MTSQGIDPCNVFNYDETNLRDEPGCKKAIFKRGVKYAEMVKDSTKSCISIMFCASATGELLPSYIVYKGQNVYPTWSEGGVNGSVYSATKSGWFDMWCFQDWFFKIFMKKISKRPGRKLLIGDNLVSHISPEVIKACRDNEIAFVCLPPNSTHMMQPLDVGLFGPMKQLWRTMLHEARDQDPTAKALAKGVFPKMLKELVNKLNTAAHMPSAFRKCGLSPFDPSQVLDRLPSKESSLEISNTIDKVLLDRLETHRFLSQSRKPRGKKVPAGQSYTAVDSDSDSSEPKSETDSETDDDDVDLDIGGGQADGAVGEGGDVGGEQVDGGVGEGGDIGGGQDDVQDEPRAGGSGDHVAAVYEGELFMAQVVVEQDDIMDGHTLLSYMTIKGRNSFAWGAKDFLTTLNEDILLAPVTPVPVNNRGHFGFEKKDYEKALRLMVVVHLLPILLLFPNNYVGRYLPVNFKCNIYFLFHKHLKILKKSQFKFVNYPHMDK